MPPRGGVSSGGKTRQHSARRGNSRQHPASHGSILATPQAIFSKKLTSFHTAGCTDPCGGLLGRKQLGLRGADRAEGIGWRLRCPKFAEEVWTKQQPGDAGEEAQVRLVVAATDQEEHVGQGAVGPAERHAARRPAEGDDVLAKRGRQWTPR